MTIGGSTDVSTAKRQTDVDGSGPASFRYNNPGAQYPSAEAAKFGQTGFGIIGGGHKIAAFPSPVNGAASNFDLLSRNYVGMTLGAAGKKWTGANGSGVPGYDDNAILTKEMVADPAKAIPLLKAFAGRESGKGSNLTEEQWRQAHQMFKAGSADAYLKAAPSLPDIAPAPGTKTGAGMLRRALEHVGEKYVNVQVPKDDANWHGPWDCAEFLSWLVYQEAGILYGCIDDNVSPHAADAYTGAWKRDVTTLGKRISVEEAAATVGAILLRYPPGEGKMGHIVLCDGRGGTVEAKGTRYGVVADTVQGRNWDTGVLIPGISYEDGTSIAVTPPEVSYYRGAPNMDPAIIAAIQQALSAKGADVGPDGPDGDFGENTERAVVAFQQAEGLTPDGEVGNETAAALGVALKGPGIPPVQPPVEQPGFPAPWDPGGSQIQLPEFKMPPLGNWLNVARYGMQLMSMLKGFDPRDITIEEYLRRAIIFLQPERPAQVIEGHATQLFDAPVPMKLASPSVPSPPKGKLPMTPQQILDIVKWVATIGPISIFLARYGIGVEQIDWVGKLLIGLIGAGGAGALGYGIFQSRPAGLAQAAAKMDGVTVKVDPNRATPAVTALAIDTKVQGIDVDRAVMNRT